MNNAYLPAGTLLQNGRYKIIRYISSGGFGCTYEAVHVKLGKKIAIKEFFVKDFCNRDETTAQVSVGTSSKKGLVNRLSGKFCEEAQALSELNHPGIVRVTDVFDENGTSYYVMDYVDGKSLSEIIKTRGPLSENLAVQFIRQVATALKYVHDHNRLHLDVKPGNIMINKEGKAILIDFGASKQYDEVDGENTSTLLGKTPGYAPIEQMGNDVVTFHPSTDIYALGGTLYKLLTGKTPLSATRRVSGEELEPLPEDISQTVKDAVMKSMELNKNHRPQSIKEFLAILDGADGNADAKGFIKDVVNDSNVSSSRMSQPEISYSDEDTEGKARKKRTVIFLAAAVVSLVVVAGIVMMKKPGPESVPESAPKPEVVEIAEHEVTDSVIKLANGETLTYTGTVNSKGLPNGKGRGIYKGKLYTGEYVGNYKDGKREGEATYRYNGTDGVQYFEGRFENDEYKEGKITDKKSGNYFKGEFLNGIPYDGKTYTKYNVLIATFVNGEEAK